MKYLKYLKYVLIHKWYVMIECFSMGLYIQGVTHDLSKFRPCEFIPYARYFYGKNEKQDRDEFDLAWLKHQKLNPHHWQYWILVNDNDGEKVIEMPQKYVREMVCDWVGAGKAQGFKSPKNDKYLETRKWFSKNFKNMKLSLRTTIRVENILNESNNAS